MDLGEKQQALLLAPDILAPVIGRLVTALGAVHHAPMLSPTWPALTCWPSAQPGVTATFSELGRPADALPVTEEAVAIRRELAAALPDRHRPDLAASLSNLGVRFSELGCPADALPVAEEAVAIRRELAAALPDRHRPELARSLSNLGDVLSALGRTSDAEAARREAEELT